MLRDGLGKASVFRYGELVALLGLTGPLPYLNTPVLRETFGIGIGGVSAILKLLTFLRLPQGLLTLSPPLIIDWS